MSEDDIIKVAVGLMTLIVGWLWTLIWKHKESARTDIAKVDDDLSYAIAERRQEFNRLLEKIDSIKESVEGKIDRNFATGMKKVDELDRTLGESLTQTLKNIARVERELRSDMNTISEEVSRKISDDKAREIVSDAINPLSQLIDKVDDNLNNLHIEIVKLEEREKIRHEVRS